MSLGIIVVGDFALATGRDQHVKFVASVLGKAAQSPAWAWFIPADRVQLAAALYEAWQRSHAVACFGGLGDGVDDCVRATINALQVGRQQVGLSRLAETESAGVVTCGNVRFFSGHPDRAHRAFEQWWLSLSPAETPLAREQVRWSLPESRQAVDARRKAREDFPSVAQRLTAATDGQVMLTFSAASKSKAQAARKAMQRALTASG
jgi:hypothetical protein